MRVNTKDLRDAVSVLSMVTGRSPVPILDCIVIDYQNGEFATLRSTDLDTEVIVEINAEGGPFHGAIDCKALKSLLKGSSASDFTNFTANETHATISVQGGASTKVLLNPIGDFPATRYEEPKAWAFSYDLYKKIEWVSRAMSDDFGTPLLSCLFCDEGTLVATDGSRLHHALIEDRGISFHISRMATIALQAAIKKARSKTPAVRVSERYAHKASGNHYSLTVTTPDRPIYTIVGKEVEVRFPPYHRVIPKHYGDTKITFDATRENLSVLKSTVYTYKIRKGKNVETHESWMAVEKDEQSVAFSSKNPVAETEIEGTLDTCYTEGPSIIFGINARYVVDALDKDQRHVWYINSEKDATVIASYEDPNQFAIVMPVKL